MSGIVSAIGAYKAIFDKPISPLPKDTMCGALCSYISDKTVVDFQPMGANFGILPKPEQVIKNKQERYTVIANESLQKMKKYIKDMMI